MEKRTGETTLQKILTPQSVLGEGLRWENFEPSKITLTEEEKEYALRAGLEKKIAEIKEILWYEKANRKQVYQKLDWNQILHIAVKDLCKEAGLNIGEFVQTEEFEIYKTLALYFSESEEFEKDGFDLNKGILLFGQVGCGKTTAMNSFRLIGAKTFSLISCNRVANDYKKDGVDAIEKYISLPSVCFDDLGIEATTKNFGDEKNVMTEVLLGRYDKEIRSGFKTHITTNLSAEEIEGYYGARVRSRIREMINQIEFPETSKDKRK